MPSWRVEPTAKLITHAASDASSPPSAGVICPHPRPPVINCTASMPPTPAVMDASAPFVVVRETYKPATIGTNRLTPRSV